MFRFNYLSRVFTKMKNAVKTYECVDLNRKIHYFYGLWPPRDTDPGWFYPIQYTFYRLHLVAMLLFLTIICPVTIHTHTDDLIQVCEDLTLVFILIMMITKTGYMLYDQERLEKLGDELEAICKLDHGYPRSKLTEDVRESTKKWSNIFTMVLFQFTAWSGIGIGMLSAYAYFKRTYYLNIWLPYDGTVSPNFEITLLVLAVFILIPLAQMTYIDMYVVVLMIHVVREFIILRTNLKHIREFAIQSITDRKRQQVKTLPSQFTQSPMERSPEELFEVITYEHSTRRKRFSYWSYNVTKRRNSRGRMYGEDILKPREHTVQEIDDEMQIRMKNCVEHHLQIVSFVHDLEDTMQIPTVVQICLYVVATCVCSTWLTLVPLKDIDVKCEAYFNLTLGLIFNTALYFFLGNQITQQSSMVREAVYDCDWFEASEGFKKSMRIIMSMANQPVQWVAGYIVKLSLATFYDLSMMIFTYYTNTRGMILS